MLALCVVLPVRLGSLDGSGPVGEVVIFSTFMAAKTVAAKEIFTAFSTEDRRKRTKPKVAH